MKILQASCSDVTWKQYLTAFEHWKTFKLIFSVTPPYTIDNVLEFLSWLFNEGKGYSSINTARSALSVYEGKIDNYFIGTHPLVTRFMKGVGRLRPPNSKYNFIWDPSKVLNTISSWGKNDTLSLNVLSKKLAALMALCSSQCVQTLSLISREDIHFVLEDRVEIVVTSRLKTSKPGQVYSMYFNKFHDDTICVLTCLKNYLDRTKQIPNAEMLFVSSRKPYKKVCSQTISKWLKSVLSDSGIDVNVFKSHSYRHASSSKAAQEGVHIDAIYKSAGWSENSRVFANFYNRPIVTSNEIMNSLLSSCRK